MTEEQLDDLKKILTKLRTAPEPYRFAYCPAGADGEPVLLVDKKKIPPRQLNELRKTAQKRVILSGTVEPSPSRKSVLFDPDGEAPGSFLKHMRSELGKAIPQLRKAKIKGDEEEGEEEEEEAAPDKSSAVREHQVARREQRDVQAEQRDLQEIIEANPAAVKRYNDATKKAQDLRYDLRKLKKEAQEAREKADKFNFWRSGKQKKADAEAASTLESRVKAMEEEIQRQEALAKRSEEEIQQGQEASAQAARLELRQARGEVALAQAGADVARADAVIAAQGLATAEDKLQRAIADAASRDEGLATKQQAAKDKEKEADRLLLAALKANDALAQLEEELGELQEAEGDNASKIEETKRKISELEGGLSEKMLAAGEAETAAKTAQSELQEAAEKLAASVPALADALDKRREAREELEEVDGRVEEAEAGVERAEEGLRRLEQNRRPRLIVEGPKLTDDAMKQLMRIAPAGDPNIRFDLEKRRIEVAYGPLELMQISNNFAITLKGFGGTQEQGTAQTLLKSFGTPGFQDQIQKRTNNLVNSSRDRLRTFTYGDCDNALSPEVLDKLEKDLPKKTGAEAIEHLLKDSDFPGIVLGESHGDNASQEFIVKNMDSLKDSGVDTFYIEHFLVEHQGLLDEFFAAEDGAPMPPALVALCKTMDGTQSAKYPNNLRGILDTARAKGMRVRGMDTALAKSQFDSAASDPEERVRRMNTLAEDVIKNDPGRKGKFVTLNGSAHSQTHAGKSGGVPGISQLLAAPSVQLAHGGGGLTLHREDTSLR